MPPQPGADSLAPPRGGLVDPTTLQLALANLSDEIGAMVRVIVKRATAHAVSREEFFRLLAAWIPTTRQQREFLRRFDVGE